MDEKKISNDEVRFIEDSNVWKILYIKSEMVNHRVSCELALKEIERKKLKSENSILKAQMELMPLDFERNSVLTNMEKGRIEFENRYKEEEKLLMERHDIDLQEWGYDDISGKLKRLDEEISEAIKKEG